MKKTCTYLIAELLAPLFGSQVANADVALSDVTGGANLCGYRITIGENARTGDWCEINSDATMTVKWHDDANYLVQNGWIRRGQLFEIGANIIDNVKFGIASITRNLNTGEINEIVEYDITQTPELNFSSSVYLAETDSVYGFVMDPAVQYYPVWKRVPGNGNLTDIENGQKLSDPYTWCPVMCPASDGKTFYGITFESDFVRLDNEGNEIKVFELPVTAKGWNTAMIYFPETKKILWSAILDNGKSALYCIDPTAKTCELVANLDDGVFFSMFGFGEQLEVDNVPGSVTNVKLNFEPGDNEGSIEFIMPATTIGGQDITESMTYNVQVDSNAEIIKGDDVYGAEGISITIPPLSNGMHTFTIWATLNGKAGPETVASKFIGNDTPKAPTQVILSESGMKITATWEAVTEGVNEGYIDLADMSYNVYLNENFMTNTKELVWDYEVPTDSELKGYNVTVIAVCKGLQSTGAVSNSVACGQPLNLDIYIAPTATESALMTYIGDGEAKWKYNDSYEPAVFSSGSHYSSAEPLDTWMFLPPINFPSAGESAKYQISFKTAVLWDFRDQDYFSVYIGKENKVDAMTKEITERQNPTIAWPEYAEYVNEFTVDEPGIYYIGVHCTSEPKQSGALLWDIAIKGLTVSVDSISSDTFRVETGNGYVNVYTSSDVMVEVFSIEGYKVAETKVNGTAKLSLPAGIYMLRAGNEVQKIRVR